jgi:diguanylate cyclase (GGDEF)-like protein
MLLIDIGHEYFNMKPGVLNNILLNIFSVLIYALPSVIAVIWFSYTHLLLYRQAPKNNIYYKLFLLPMVVNIIISFISVFWPLYFSVDANNLYTRGNIYLLSIILQYFYLMVPIFMVMANRNKMNNYKFFPMVFFTIPPMIGGLIQAFHYGVLLIWPMLAFSVFVGYIFIQSKLIATDYLTGLMNKGAFENHIENVKMENKKNQVLSVTVFDLDGLKQFNDNFGHLTGDKVLSIFSEVLVKSFGRNDFLARFGGDEFVILKYIHFEDDLLKCLETLENRINQINLDKSLPMEIRYSYGSKIYYSESNQSIKSIIEAADKTMYEYKILKSKEN